MLLFVSVQLSHMIRNLSAPRLTVLYAGEDEKSAQNTLEFAQHYFVSWESSASLSHSTHFYEKTPQTPLNPSLFLQHFQERNKSTAAGNMVSDRVSLWWTTWWGTELKQKLSISFF